MAVRWICSFFVVLENLGVHYDTLFSMFVGFLKDLKLMTHALGCARRIIMILGYSDPSWGYLRLWFSKGIPQKSPKHAGFFHLPNFNGYPGYPGVMKHLTSRSYCSSIYTDLPRLRCCFWYLLRRWKPDDWKAFWQGWGPGYWGGNRFGRTQRWPNGKTGRWKHVEPLHHRFWWC